MMKNAHNPVVTQDLERAEALLLGSLLLHPERVTTVRAMLPPADFSREDHRLIYESLLTVADMSEHDMVRAIGILLTQDELERIGGIPYLARLKLQAEDTSIPVEEQANHLKQTIINFLLMQVNEALRDSAAQKNGQIRMLAIDHLERAIGITRQLLPPKLELPLSPSSLQGDLTNYVSDLETRRNTHAVLSGIATGFTDLDTLTGGLQPADLIIVAGPPSSGKTGFALSIALHVLLKAHRSIGLFSLEASRKQVIGRLLSMQANLDQRLIRSLEVEDEDWSLLKGASVNLSEAKLWIDDSASLSTTQLCDKAHELVHHYGVELIIVDYVHLMLSNIQDKRHENRVHEVGEISRSLKVLARELNIPILALAQVSRAFENRQTKNLRLSDLRDGSLENDADLVLFLSVDEREPSQTAVCLLATISIAKHRNGPRAELDVCFYPGSTWFCDLQTLSQPPMQGQAMLSHAKDDRPKVVLKPSSSRRELPRGYFLEHEEAEPVSGPDRSMTTCGGEQEQSHEST